MSAAFDLRVTDFSGIDGGRGLFLRNVVHESVVEVDERGTEAAAASGGFVALGGEPPPPPLFRADHPFLFLIMDRRTGTVLFLGRVVDPTAG